MNKELSQTSTEARSSRPSKRSQTLIDRHPIAARFAVLGLAVAGALGIAEANPQVSINFEPSVASAASDLNKSQVFLVQDHNRRLAGQDPNWVQTVDMTNIQEVDKYIRLMHDDPAIQANDKVCITELEDTTVAEDADGHWRHSAVKVGMGSACDQPKVETQVQTQVVTQPAPEVQVCILNGQPFGGEQEIGSGDQVEVNGDANHFASFKGGMVKDDGTVMDVADGSKQAANWFLNDHIKFHPRERGNFVCPPGWPQDTVVFNMLESEKTQRGEGREPITQWLRQP